LQSKQIENFATVFWKKNSAKFFTPQLDKPEQRSIHSLENFPEDLRKKITLLKHFKNYLIANGPNPKDNTQATIGE
jgi:hypothetical protein